MIQQSFTLDTRITHIPPLESIEACPGSIFVTARPICLRAVWHPMSVLGRHCKRLPSCTFLLSRPVVSPLLRMAVYGGLGSQRCIRLSCALALQRSWFWSLWWSFGDSRSCEYSRRWRRGHDDIVSYVFSVGSMLGSVVKLSMALTCERGDRTGHLRLF